VRLDPPGIAGQIREALALLQQQPLGEMAG
jgi:hypothetical protein